MSTGLSVAQKKQLEVRNNLRSVLQKGAAEFASVLPAHITPERMIRIAMTSATTQPKLLECSPQSVALALLAASQTGLEPDGYHAHLVPYKTTCQFIPDYKGLIQLALDSAVVVDAHAVYEKDEFEYELGTNPHIRHIPSEEEDRGAVRCAYAVATFENGRTKFVVATKSDIERRRRASPGSGSKDSPWNQWYPEMAMKTAVKMLSKFIPRSPRLQAAIVHSDMADRGLQQSPLNVLASSVVMEPPQPSKVEQMGQAMLEQAGGLDLKKFGSVLAHCTTEQDAQQCFQDQVVSLGEQVSPDDYERAYDLVSQHINLLREAGAS